MSPSTLSLFYCQLVVATNSWLKIQSGWRGTIAPGDTFSVNFVVQPHGLPAGQVDGLLVIQNNDPQRRTVNIPVLVDVLTGFPGTDSDIPQRFALMQNFPNPFNPLTTIRYELPRESKVVLKIYNVIGQEVATLVNDVQRAGRYGVNFTSEGLASGVYFYRLQANDFVETKKLLLLK